jgi:Skp family chaperone for outer membrane proteins
MFLENKKFFVFLCLLLVSSFASAEKKSNQLEKIEAAVPSSRTTLNNKISKTTPTKLDYESKNQIIFCVNRDEIFEKSKIAASIKKEMQEFEQQIIAELKPMAEKFEEMRLEYEKKAKTLKREALMAEEEKIAQLAQEVQMKQMESQEAYRRKEATLTKEFLLALTEACKEFLKRDENANVVLLPVDNGTYVHSKYDATTKILEIMDAKVESNKKTVKPEPKK